MAKKEGLDCFVVAIGPTQVTSAVKPDTTSAHQYVAKVPHTYNGYGVNCTMFRHVTGPLSKQVFYNTVVLKAVNSIGFNVVQALVKSEEKRRRDAVSLQQFVISWRQAA